MPPLPNDLKSPRTTSTAMTHGWRQNCPACRQGRLFGRYLKVNDQCSHCETELHHHRADDAPPYFTMFIVGHIVIAALLYVERGYAPPVWLHLALWLPLTLGLSLWLLPRVKGALIGLQWATRMHGFGSDTATNADSPEAMWPTAPGRSATPLPKEKS
jgi:uncharacterized protein (DUF983 family)